MKNRLCGQLLWVALFLTGPWGRAQTEQGLADEYYRNGEFDKAAVEYGRQVRKSEEQGGPSWPMVYRYITSLDKAKNRDEANQQLKSWLKTSGNLKTYAQVLMGARLQEAGDTTSANKQYASAFETKKNDPSQLTRLSDWLTDVNATDWAIKSLQQAQKLADDLTLRADELADLYRAKNDIKRWVETLMPLARRSDRQEAVQTAYQSLLNTRDEPILEQTLYEHVQKEPESVAVNDMLTWYFVQKQKFSRALMQEKAIDKRLKLSGAKVFELTNLALINHEYKTAIDGCEYIIANYKNGTYYPYARRMLINAREEQVKNTYPVNKNEIRKLISDYQQMLSEVGMTPKTLEAMRSAANLYANYLDEKDSAVVMLDKAILLGRTDPLFVDKCKLDKGDIYLLKDEPWEATLLYSQVEKSQKEDLLGYEAKLRNAKLHYYKGDFTAAKSILDVLKLATSREIANDAEQLSILILDNTGLDSTEAAMRDYSAIDLLLFQNKLDEANGQINEMLKKYQSHTLADELLWLQAKLLTRQNKVDEAISNLMQLVKLYPLDILGDDALYEAARLTDERKKDSGEALKLYQQFLTTYPGSIYAAEARRRIRQLRGDAVN